MVKANFEKVHEGAYRNKNGRRSLFNQGGRRKPEDYRPDLEDEDISFLSPVTKPRGVR
jgi:hypothetical protein